MADLKTITDQEYNSVIEYVNVLQYDIMDIPNDSYIVKEHRADNGAKFLVDKMLESLGIEVVCTHHPDASPYCKLCVEHYKKNME